MTVQTVGDDGYSRAGESPAVRLDRNYGELLQELRVAQNGVQILFAFLLGIAFQTRFTHLQPYQRGIYLVTLLAAASAAITLVAPAAAHRVLFRRHRKRELVELTSRLAAVGLSLLAFSILSAVLLVLDVVVNLTAGIVSAGVLALVIAGLWVALPREVRRRYASPELDPDDHGVPAP